MLSFKPENSWWSFLRQSETDWCIKFFKDLRDSWQSNDDNLLHRDCLRFCFTRLIQEELSRVAKHWNLHKIRPSSNTESPPHRPDVLFYLPQLRETADRETAIPCDEIEIAKEMCSTAVSETGCCEEFIELANLIMEEQGLHHPSTTDEALIIYRRLVSSLENVL